MSRPVNAALAAALATALVACGSSDSSGSPAASGSPASMSSATSPGTGATASPASGASAGGASPAGSATPGGGAPPTASTAPGEGASGVTDPGAWARIPEIIAEAQPKVVSILSGTGEGSGVIWSEDGIVITNDHVVAGAPEVIVAFADGTRAEGRVLATDPLSDLAVVETDRTGLPAAEFNTELPPIGALALALGNPLGFENSATAGIVSGAHRSVPGAAQQAPALVDLIQTDAAISPGNSGGALVGADGRLIGVNVAYIPPQAGSVSIGFAIPSSTVVDVVEQLLEDGTAEHAWLGVQPVAMTPQIAAQYDLPTDTGALVVEVVEGSPADEAGLVPGDVIVAIEDDPVATVEDLLAALRRREVGAEVGVFVAREGGQTEELRATLGSFGDAG